MRLLMVLALVGVSTGFNTKPAARVTDEGEKHVVGERRQLDHAVSGAACYPNCVAAQCDGAYSCDAVNNHRRRAETAWRQGHYMVSNTMMSMGCDVGPRRTCNKIVSGHDKTYEDCESWCGSGNCQFCKCRSCSSCSSSPYNRRRADTFDYYDSCDEEPCYAAAPNGGATCDSGDPSTCNLVMHESCDECDSATACTDSELVLRG